MSKASGPGIREIEQKEKNAREKIIDYAKHFGMEILFKSDIEIGRDNVKLKWNNGNYVIYTVQVLPTLINDNSTILLDSRIRSTIHQPPSLIIDGVEY